MQKSSDTVIQRALDLAELRIREAEPPRPQLGEHAHCATTTAQATAQAIARADGSVLLPCGKVLPAQRGGLLAGALEAVMVDIFVDPTRGRVTWSVPAAPAALAALAAPAAPAAGSDQSSISAQPGAENPSASGIR